MLKALLLAIMKLFAYLLVLHQGIDNLLLPPRREYSVSRLEGTRECNLCDSSVRILSNSLLQIVSLRINNGTTPARTIAGIITTIREDYS